MPNVLFQITKFPTGPEINRLLEILAELGVLTRAEGSNLYLAPPLLYPGRANRSSGNHR